MSNESEAMLTFSNFGSARHPASERVSRVTALVRERAPDLMVDGEMQADAAILATYPFNALRRPANVLIFPDLDSANISYKLLWRLGGVAAIGPTCSAWRVPCTYCSAVVKRRRS